MTIFPCPTFPLAMHSTFGQNCVEAFICSSVVFCIVIVYRCLPLFQVAPASPPPVNAALPQKVVREIYNQLINSNTSAIILRGLNGIGASTVAKLVCSYAENQRLRGTAP